MEAFVKKHDLRAKHPSEADLEKWRRNVLFLNPRRRFRYVADLNKRAIHEKRVLSIQDKLYGNFVRGRRLALKFMPHPELN
ncbi:hypothetical protein L1987_33663 [Smallanthus sonchifolius]|uniref:Uncharacterized protein n=1 Tax=Smallanthus sonchifolius TaxID=185202 RepID=A0ACB9HSH5_9ASTR|nr:hypothetical protein L1987_33663 [Smallanthus sonchifolius]